MGTHFYVISITIPTYHYKFGTQFALLNIKKFGGVKWNKETNMEHTE
jgi:hypothetical protein